jgi:hypothetical protein
VSDQFLAVAVGTLLGVGVYWIGYWQGYWRGVEVTERKNKTEHYEGRDAG